MSASIGLLREAQRARMTITRPWRQHEQQASIGASEDFVTLLWFELEQRPGTAEHARVAAGLHLDLTGDYDQPCMLMNLVITEAFPGGKLKQHNARSRG